MAESFEDKNGDQPASKAQNVILIYWNGGLGSLKSSFREGSKRLEYTKNYVYGFLGKKPGQATARISYKNAAKMH
jgi:hypothetical protein